MSSARLILVLLIVTTPVTIIFDGPAIQGLLAAITILLLVTIAIRIRPGEAQFLSNVIRPLAAVAPIPAIWMLVQVVPLQNVGLAHPVWKSASAAIGHPLLGSISIDPGATLISFVRYLSAALLAMAAAAVAVDRHRAKIILFALMIATSLIALMALVARIGFFTSIGTRHGAQTGAAMVAGAGLGMIFAIAAALHILEQDKPRKQNGNASSERLWMLLAACVSAFAVCLVAVIARATGQIYYAIVCGVASFAFVIVVRRYNFGAWGIAAIVTMLLFGTIAAMALRWDSRTLDLALAFASQVPRSQLVVTQRLLSETSWLGTGAGTFAAILPIYQNIDDLTNGVAPTAAAAIIVEMGKPFFWATMMAAVALVWGLFRGALQRHRDSFYPATGACCVVVIALLSFANSALLSSPISTIVTVAIGMAIAQSRSRLV